MDINILLRMTIVHLAWLSCVFCQGVSLQSRPKIRKKEQREAAEYIQLFMSLRFCFARNLVSCVRVRVCMCVCVRVCARVCVRQAPLPFSFRLDGWICLSLV